MTEDIDKRLRTLEQDMSVMKDKCIDFGNKLQHTDSKHMSACNFLLYKDELIKKIDTIKKDISDKVEDETGFIDDKVITTEKSFKEQLEDQKNHFYKVIAILTGIMMFVLSVNYGMQKDKVSSDDYQRAIEQLSEAIEQQIDNQNKMITEMTNIKINVGIMSNKIDQIDSHKRNYNE